MSEQSQNAVSHRSHRAGSEPSPQAWRDRSPGAELEQQPHAENGHIDVRLSREEAESLVLAVDALQPLLQRIRAEVAPEPEPEQDPPAPEHADALQRAKWLARESLREARVAIGERQVQLEQRKAWQDAARRYAAARAALTRTRGGS